MTDGPRTGVAGIDADLSMIHTAVGKLRDLSHDPKKSDDHGRVYDFSIRWGTLMSGRLKRLEHYRRAGELTGAQEQSYRELRRELGDVVPLIERLGITRPTVPLED